MEKIYPVLKLLKEFQCNSIQQTINTKKIPGVITFTPNKSYAYLLYVEPSALLFFKTYNTEFDCIINTFFDKNRRLLEIENKIDFTLFINKRNDTLVSGWERHAIALVCVCTLNIKNTFLITLFIITLIKCFIILSSTFYLLLFFSLATLRLQVPFTS